jgi:hypothetical protein
MNEMNARGLHFLLGQRQARISLQTALNLDPFMIHETFLCLTETAFGSHPCRVVSVTYRKLRPFHGGNTGSNPVGDANKIKYLQEPQPPSSLWTQRATTALAFPDRTRRWKRYWHRSEN